MPGHERTGPLLCLAAAALAGCAGPPETLAWLTFDADGPSDARADELVVRVCNDENDLVLQRTYGDPDWPFRVELTPRDGDTSRRYWALAELWSGAGPLARKRVHSGYEPEVQLEHDVRFEAACLDQLDCGLGESCENGTCVDARRAPVPATGDPPAPPFACGFVFRGDTVCATPPPGTLFCEGFEQEVDGLWDTSTSSGTIAVDRDAAFRGDRSLHATTEGTPNQAWMHGRLFGAAEAIIHARAQVFVRSGTPFGHAEVLRVERADPTYGIGVQIVGPAEPENGELRIIQRESSRNPTTDTGLPFPYDEWFCISLTVELSEAGDVTVAGPDGGTFTLEDVGTSPSGGDPYDTVRAGVIFATDAGLDMHVDEVVVATEPLPCDG